MEVIAYDEISHDMILARVAEVVKGGGVAAVPTDTVYGLICDARNEAAIRRMFAMKQRPEEKVFPIFVKDIAAARYYGYISDAKARFLEKVWPGQVTVVFQHKEKLPRVLRGDKDTIGIRLPDHPFLLELLGRLDFPLAQTSANISENPPARNAAEVAAYFEKEEARPDLIIDGGPTLGTSSTVVDFTGNEPIILRAGPITKSELDRILDNF